MPPVSPAPRSHPLAPLRFRLLLLLCLFSAPAYAAQPHLIFILIDDYGHTDVGYHNKLYDNNLKTPNLDSLAHDGIKLENYYVQPICTPTRSQLLSGRYQ